MSTANLEDMNTTIDEEPKQPRRKRWPLILSGVVIMLLIIGLGAFFGYQNGIDRRKAEALSMVQQQASEQFELALIDKAMGRYENAQARFEYVIQLDPSFPQAADQLAQVMVAINLARTPTITPTPTPIPATPTPDLRGFEDIFQQVKQLLANKEWDKALQTLDSLRQANKDYKTVDVDGMYYVALRNLGVDNILRQGNLEGGIYDLALAERFGPLDAEADGYRTWARLYITGASFWDIDWSQVVYFFGQIYPALPNLRDGSYMTATERFRVGSIKYGDQLAAAGDYCKAKEQYDAALAISADEKVQPTAQYAGEQCGQSSDQQDSNNITPVDQTPTETPVPQNSEPTQPPTDTPQESQPTDTPQPFKSSGMPGIVALTLLTFEFTPQTNR